MANDRGCQELSANCGNPALCDAHKNWVAPNVDFPQSQARRTVSTSLNQMKNPAGVGVGNFAFSSFSLAFDG